MKSIEVKIAVWTRIRSALCALCVVMVLIQFMDILKIEGMALLLAGQMCLFFFYQMVRTYVAQLEIYVKENPAHEPEPRPEN